MPKKKRHKRRSGGASTVTLRPTPSGGAWVLVPPRCARDRSEDLEEVRLMIGEGETEVALDELRWLLSGCSDCLDAHLLLGELAVKEKNDIPLARGHFGYAYQLGLRAWHRAGEPVPVPYAQPANRTFHESGRSLAWCLEKLEKPTMATEIVATLTRLDPTDPLGLNDWLAKIRGDGELPLA